MAFFARFSRHMLMALLTLGGLAPVAQADCVPSTFQLTLATPASSRISRVGDPIRAVLPQPIVLQTRTLAPAGTVLTGKVTEVQSSDQTRQPGRLKLRFHRAAFTDGTQLDGLVIVPETRDGWLHPEDMGTDAWRVSPRRSTRMLNQKLQRRLGSDMSVWNSILHINSNVIPDPSTDEFIRDYHRRDVLLGAGDILTVHARCP